MPTTYTHLDPDHPPHGRSDIFRWAILDRIRGRRRPRPPGPPAPRIEPDLELIHRRGGAPRLTWIGHSSLLGTLGGASFLVDPVFSQRVGWVYRRHGLPALTAEELPPLTAVLCTHNHYDHLDRPSLDAIPSHVPVVVPRGLESWVKSREKQAVVELQWWQSTVIGDLTLTLVPARHWSRRGIGDTNQSLWGGFVITGSDGSVYAAGDSAYFPGFAEIGHRFPGLLAAALPIGAYDPQWFMGYNHLNPEEAGRAFLDTGARTMVPIHWGAFQLTDEPISEPAGRLEAWWAGEGPADGRRLAIPAVGETVVLENRAR